MSLVFSLRPVRVISSTEAHDVSPNASRDQAQLAAKSGNRILKDIPCRVSLAKKSENSGTNNNWKTALFLFGRIRGTVCNKRSGLRLSCWRSVANRVMRRLYAAAFADLRLPVRQWHRDFRINRLEQPRADRRYGRI
ncbi:hypothetical protein [Bradyrhizobium sp. dw_78]|uniref:hypothetical protein n=1 Tax=Bradyrhizobium sp. dw_78 TaxID=2719793 RepID=UPI001BD2730A|nr:hypothetical protein [Bradyrhizobium sp. dw_78]